MSDQSDSEPSKSAPSSSDPVTMETVTIVVTSPKPKLTLQSAQQLDLPDSHHPHGDNMGNKLESKDRPTCDAHLESLASLDVPPEQPALDSPTFTESHCEKRSMDSLVCDDIRYMGRRRDMNVYIDQLSEEIELKVNSLRAKAKKPELDPMPFGRFGDIPFDDLSDIDILADTDDNEILNREDPSDEWFFPPLDNDVAELNAFLDKNHLVTATLTGPVESEMELSIRKKQIEVLNSFEPKDNQTVRDNLCRGMPDTSSLEAALTSLPPGLVITFTQLVKLRLFSLAEVMVDTMLRKRQCMEERQTWANNLKDVVKQLTTKSWMYIKDFRFMDDPMYHSLMNKLSTVDKIEICFDDKPPNTIEEAFKTDWKQMFTLYEQQKDGVLTKAELHLVNLVAAWKDKWDIFLDSAHRGADIIKAHDDVHTTQRSLQRLYINAIRDAEDIKSLLQRKPELSTLEDCSRRSPLHEVLRSGSFELSQVESVFPDDLVNAVDFNGYTLLHLAIQGWNQNVSLSNIRFLMQHGADPGVKDSYGMTVIQSLVSQGYIEGFSDMLIEVLTGAESIPPHCWQPVRGCSALNIVVSRGLHQHILPFIEKGANKCHLQNKLTLIDTVVMEEKLSYSARRDTLAVLLAPPISLGPFHASVVQKRPLDENRDYQTAIHLGTNYVFPLVRLFFPVISTHRLRKANLGLAKLLLEGQAVCQDELMALASYMTLLESEGLTEVVEYFHDKIELVQHADTHQHA